MSGKLPEVPAGRNPWQIYREALDFGFYNSPSKGFSARIYVLWTLLLYSTLIAMVYTALLLLDYRRKKRRVWLAKLVKRPSGAYIALNQHILVSFFTMGTSLALFGYVYSEWDVFTHKVPYNTSLLYRTWVWVPVWFQGYLIVSASLQAYIITSEGVEKGGFTISAPVANGIFLGLGGAILAETIISCAICTIRWKSFYKAYNNLHDVLAGAEAAWTGTLDLTRLASVQTDYTALAKAYAPFLKAQKAVTFSYVAAPLVLVLLNIGAIRLIFTLRKQIAYSTRRGNVATAPIQSEDHYNPYNTGLKITGDSQYGSAYPPTSPSLLQSPASQQYAFDGAESKQSDTTETSNATEMTGFSHVPSYFSHTSSGHSHLLAKRGKALPLLTKGQTEREKTLASLRRAEAELVIVAAAAIFLSTIFTVISLWTAIAAISINIGWASLETTVFFVPWAWASVAAVGLTLLSIHVLKAILYKPPMVLIDPGKGAKPGNASRPAGVSKNSSYTGSSHRFDLQPPANVLSLRVAEDGQTEYWQQQQNQWGAGHRTA